MWLCWVLVATCGIFLCGSQISLLLWWEGSRACGLQLQHQSFQWIFRTDFLEDRLVGSPCCPRDSQESSPTPQLESINSSVLSLLYGPSLTSIALTIQIFVGKLISLLFNMLSGFVIAFLPRSKHLLISCCPMMATTLFFVFLINNTCLFNWGALFIIFVCVYLS